MLLLSSLTIPTAGALAKSNLNSAKAGDRFACLITEQAAGGSLVATQFLAADGTPSHRTVRWSGTVGVMEAEDARSMVDISWFRNSGDAELDEFGLGLLTLTLDANWRTKEPVDLRLSRGPYVNVDLGLGKSFDDDDQSVDGSIEAIDTIVGLLNFADGERSVGWALTRINLRRQPIALGSVDLSFVDSLRASFSLLDTRLDKMRVDHQNACRRVKVVER